MTEEQISKKEQDLCLGLYKKRDFSRLSDVLNELIEKYPQSFFCYQLRAAARSSLDNLPGAVDDFRRALQLNPNFYQGHYNIGLIFIKLGKTNDAINAFNEAIGHNKKFLEAYVALGNAHVKNNEPTSAVGFYSKALELDNKNHGALLNYGTTLLHVGDPSGALPLLKEAVAVMPKDATSICNLAKAYDRLEELDLAEKKYKLSLVYAPFHFPALVSLVDLLCRRNKRSEVELVFQQYQASHSSYFEYQKLMGDTYIRFGDLQAAASAYLAGSRLKPDSIEILSALGTVYRRLKDYSKSRECYLLALKLDPDNFSLAYNLGILHYHENNLDLAVESFQSAITFDSERFEPHFQLGKAYGAMGDFEKGCNSLDYSLQLQPESKDARLFKFLFENVDPLDFQQNIHKVSEPFQYHGHVPFDQELIACLHKINAQSLPGNLSIANDPRYGRGYCSPDFNLFEVDLPEVKKVSDVISSVLLEHYKKIFIYESFFNVLKEGGGTKAHTHLSGHDLDKNFSLQRLKYSLVYYLEVGDQTASEPGYLNFHDPDDKFLPSSGSLVIFPAWHKHSSSYNGLTSRTMIGANFYAI